MDTLTSPTKVNHKPGARATAQDSKRPFQKRPAPESTDDEQPLAQRQHSTDAPSPRQGPDPPHNDRLFRSTLVEVFNNREDSWVLEGMAEQVATLLIGDGPGTIESLKLAFKDPSKRATLRELFKFPMHMIRTFLEDFEAALNNATQRAAVGAQDDVVPSPELRASTEANAERFCTDSSVSHDYPPSPRQGPDPPHNDRLFRSTLVEVFNNREDSWVLEGMAEQVATLLIGDGPGTIESLKLAFKDPSKRATLRELFKFPMHMIRTFLEDFEAALNNATQRAAVGAQDDVVPSPELRASTEANAERFCTDSSVSVPTVSSLHSSSNLKLRSAMRPNMTAENSDQSQGAQLTDPS